MSASAVRYNVRLTFSVLCSRETEKKGERGRERKKVEREREKESREGERDRKERGRERERKKGEIFDVSK